MYWLPESPISFKSDLFFFDQCSKSSSNSARPSLGLSRSASCFQWLFFTHIKCIHKQICLTRAHTHACTHAHCMQNPASVFFAVLFQHSPLSMDLFWVPFEFYDFYPEAHVSWNFTWETFPWGLGWKESICQEGFVYPYQVPRSKIGCGSRERWWALQHV